MDGVAGGGPASGDPSYRVSARPGSGDSGLNAGCGARCVHRSRQWRRQCGARGRAWRWCRRGACARCRCRRWRGARCPRAAAASAWECFPRTEAASVVGVRHRCATLLAAIKVEVQFDGMGMWRRGGGVGLSWPWCRFCHAVHVQLGVGMLWAKALAGVAGGMTAASLTSLSPLGASFWSYNSAARGSLGENLVL